MSTVRGSRSGRQVELILQSGPRENAAAALAMVLAYYGRSVPVRELARQGMASAADLAAAAQRRGLYAQGYQMSWEELCRAPKPLIAHWRFRSFVVVTGVRGGRVYLHSPEEGRRVLSRQEFEAGYTGVTVCFAPGEGETAPRAADRPLRGLLSQVSGTALLLGAAQLFLWVCYAVLAMRFRILADLIGSPQQAGAGLYLQIGAAAALQGGVMAFQLWLLRKCRDSRQTQLTRQLRARLAEESSSFFQETAQCRLEALARGCARWPQSASWAVFYGLQLAGGAICLVLMALQVPLSALAALLIAAAYGAAGLLSRDRLYSDTQLADREHLWTVDQAAGDLEQADERHLRGESRARFAAWVSQAGGACRPEGGRRLRLLWYGAASALVLAVAAVCCLEMITGQARMADLLGCLILAAGAAASLRALPGLLEEYARAAAARALAGQVLEEEEHPALGVTGLRAGSLTLQDVTLRPAAGERPAVKGLTFTVRRGEVLVVEGEPQVRACLAQVAAGLERPAQGQLYLDSLDAAGLSDRELCGNIALLGEGVPFPQGTVRENIAASLRGITDYSVVEAASDALLHRSILGRTAGYDTPVASLSRGERVLLEFACAFSRGTPFLVWNGLTELLDRETETALLQALRRRGLGAVVLTGDPQLLRQGDLVCRIRDGRVVLRERGELMAGEVHSHA